MIRKTHFGFRLNNKVQLQQRPPTSGMFYGMTFWEFIWQRPHKNSTHFTFSISSHCFELYNKFCIHIDNIKLIKTTEGKIKVVAVAAW